MIERPSRKQILRYLATWESRSDVQVADEALQSLFCLYPKNQELFEIYLKVNTLNSFYRTRVKDMNMLAVAEYIQSQNIDIRLEQGDISLVNDLARSFSYSDPIDNSERLIERRYSFASKYCSFHQPDKYYIYDQFVDIALWETRKRFDQFAVFRRGRIYEDYLEFFRVEESFSRFYGFDEEFSRKDLDKYLWFLGQDYQKALESAASEDVQLLAND